MTDIRTPALSKELVEWLSRTFPDRCADPKDSDRQVWIDVGKQVVIRKIRAEYEKSLTSSTETHV